MNIGTVNHKPCGYGLSQKVQGAAADKTAFGEELESKATKNPLAYYKDLCRDFPDITFRLDDKAETAKRQNSNQVYLGYNNSMNQVGENFGEPGQCSISIDISVIERMQKDPEYEAHVRGMIQDTRQRYAEFAADAAADGQPFISVTLEDDNGNVQRSITQSGFPYSTEEEVKYMWGNRGAAENFLQKFEEEKRSLLESYLKMLDDSRRRQEELWGKSAIPMGGMLHERNDV